MNPENPERLHAAAWARVGGSRYLMAADSREQAERFHDAENSHRGPDRCFVAPVQEYVRADIAAAREAALVAERDALLSRVQRLRLAMEPSRGIVRENSQSCLRQARAVDVAAAALFKDDKAASSGKGVG